MRHMRPMPYKGCEGRRNMMTANVAAAATAPNPFQALMIWQCGWLSPAVALRVSTTSRLCSTTKP
jgi:hypothetical protein